MPSALVMKLIGAGIGILALLGLVLGLKHYKSLAESRGQSLALICQTTRDASGNPKMKCSEVPAQIKFMGDAIGTLTAALHKQNDAVAALGEETTRQQNLAVNAANQATQRQKPVAAAQQRLEASARSDGRKSAPCDLSPTLKDTWK